MALKLDVGGAPETRIPCALLYKTEAHTLYQYSSYVGLQSYNSAGGCGLEVQNLRTKKRDALESDQNSRNSIRKIATCH